MRRRFRTGVEVIVAVTCAVSCTAPGSAGRPVASDAATSACVLFARSAVLVTSDASYSNDDALEDMKSASRLAAQAAELDTSHRRLATTLDALVEALDARRYADIASYADIVDAICLPIVGDVYGPDVSFDDDSAAVDAPTTTRWPTTTSRHLPPTTTTQLAVPIDPAASLRYFSVKLEECKSVGLPRDSGETTTFVSVSGTLTNPTDEYLDVFLYVTVDAANGKLVSDEGLQRVASQVEPHETRDWSASLMFTGRPMAAGGTCHLVGASATVLF
jgi:hypothetical protein